MADCPNYILVVDDETELAETIQEILESQGYRVKSAVSAEAALKLVRESLPALIIADTNMPEKSGLDLLEDVRNVSKDLPVIMMSGFSSTEKIRRALQWGVSEFLDKPIDFGKLQEIIQKNLKPGTPRLNNEVQLNLPASLFENLQKRAKSEDLSLPQLLEKMLRDA